MQETETESRDGSRGAAQETPAREITWSDWLATQEGSWGWGRSGSGIYMPQWVGGGGCDGGERGEEKGVVPLRSPTVVAGCVGVGHRSGEED